MGEHSVCIEGIVMIVTHCIHCKHELYQESLGPCQYIVGMTEGDTVICGCTHISHYTKEVTKLSFPEPTRKSLDIQAAVSGLMGHEHSVYERNDCADCGKTGLEPTDFRDEISRHEFGISRMCQGCQDKVFEA